MYCMYSSLIPCRGGLSGTRAWTFPHHLTAPAHHTLINTLDNKHLTLACLCGMHAFMQRRSLKAKGLDENMLYDARMAHFTCGLLAGLCAKMATHPLDVAKKRFQVAGLQRSLRCGACVRRASVGLVGMAGPRRGSRRLGYSGRSVS